LRPYDLLRDLPLGENKGFARVREEKISLASAHAVDARPLELTVVVPTFNEIDNVKPLLEALDLALAGIHWEAVFVDDDSPDGTADCVRAIGRTDTRVRIIHRVGRRGLSSAVVEGMLDSAAPVIAVIDGDMQHDENALPRLFEAVKNGAADIAIGTRYNEGGSVGDWGSSRQRISNIANSLGRFLLRTPLSDPMSGFFAIRRETFMAVLPNLSMIGFKILIDIVASSKATPRIVEIPYHFRNRVAGESKLDTMVVTEYVALLVDKYAGHILPLRLMLFLMVGGLGVIVHMSVLAAVLWAGLTFAVGEVAAVGAAMTFNFFLNNVFTYRDRQLHGWKMLRGLLSFYAVCGIGALANIGVGIWVNAQDGRWWVAGLAGVVIGAIWNYAASSFVTWRR
jgi:dolichol-phosphate mannosyltransferase